jgi:RNA polymerase sigma-70 factor (ECF subfamily)
MGASPPRSFEDLYREHEKYVWRFTCRMGVPFDDIPDVTQKVFTALHEAMVSRNLDTGTSIKAWLRAVTFRAARDHLDHAHREREVLSSDGAIEAADAAPDPEERMVRIDVHRFVGRVLGELPHELHLVLVMSEIEEMTGKDIAAELGLPEGTVSSRIRAGRRAFEAAFNQQRATGNAAVMPFALWSADDLLHAARATPDVPEQMMDEVWRRLVQAIPGLSGAGAATAAGTAAATAKAGAVITAKQAAGFMLSALLGAGIAVLATGEAPKETGAKLGLTSTAVAVMSPPASASAAPPPVAVVAPTPTSTAAASASAAGSVSPEVIEANDRMLLDKARGALDRGDYAAARASLLRVRSPRFAPEREMHLRDVAAHMDGGR